MAPRTLIISCAFLAGLGVIATGIPTKPTQAFCKVVWLLAVPCSQVNVAILSQIKAMSSYTLGPVTPTTIQANHTSMVGQQENVTFTMFDMSTGLGCHVRGSSVSAFWYSLFDNGTNYCNLENVMRGSGLSRFPGFTEYTNEWICMGYGLSDCKAAN